MSNLSVITVTHNSSHIIGGFLRCLMGDDPHQDEVIVVDSGSADVETTRGEVAAWGARWLPIEENVGFGAGNNRGALVANHEWLAFVNPDVAVSIDQLRVLVRCADDAGVTCIGPRILASDGAERAFRREEMAPPWRRRRFVPSEVGDLEFAASISGACMVMRRREFNALGGFDERFFMFCEEIDLHKRIRSQGGSVARVRSIDVVTPGGASSAGVTSRWSAAERELAHVRYTAKHYTGLEAATDFLYRALRILVLPRFRPRVLSIAQFWSGVWRTVDHGQYTECSRKSG